MYNKFLSGSFLFYSYGKEGFHNLLSPKILEVLFSPNNGLIIYTPIFLVFSFGFIYSIFKKNINGWIGLFSFLLMIYISASWWAWAWGCSLSMRPMVDILPILIIPFTAFINWVYDRNSIVKISFLTPLLLFFIYMNVQFSNTYNHCFEGDTWQWAEYNKIMRRANIFPFTTEYYRDIFDKEDKTAVHIKTKEGDYLQMTKNNTIVAVSQSEVIVDNSLFQLVQVSGGRISIKCDQDKYVCSDLNNNGVCVANRNEIGVWEIFFYHPLENDLFVLENFEGKYLKFDPDKNFFLAGITSNIDSAQQLKFEYIDTIVSK